MGQLSPEDIVLESLNKTPASIVNYAEISFQEINLFKTQDNSYDNKKSLLEGDSVEEMLHLSEKPHPLPEKPRNSI